MRKVLLFLLFPFFLAAQSSWNMNLLGSFDYPSTQGNDIWGWVDPNGNEYALVGLRNGFSVVNVTNPSFPTEEFFISDLNSTWRDVKTWGNYAYVTTEANAGLLIVDLTDMTGNTYWHVTQFTNSNTGASVTFTSAHNLYIDENGVCYIFGAGSNSGSNPSDGVIFLDVDANPTSPVYLGDWDDEYIHDGMVRGDTLYAGCILTGDLYIIDVSIKTNPVTLASHPTPNAFTHNAWISDDGNYVFTTDEKSGAYLAAYDVSDLSNIQEVDRIQSNPGSGVIPHNTHVDGNFLVTSYYRDGTTVHDITYPEHMIQVAYYDSYSGSGNGFDGCWGTYPFLPSGNIISSEINSGAGGKGRLLIYGRNFQQACYIKGTVTDAISSAPISNASVDILSTSINENTNLLGFYQTASVNSGTFQVVFSASGYTSDTLTVSLVNGVMTILNAALFPPCNTLNIVTNNNVQICDSSYSIGNSTYISTGIYSDTLINYFGCDSIVTTNLTINNSTSNSTTLTQCDAYLWPLNGTTYNTSGTYTNVSTNAVGCNHTEILNLSITNSTSNTSSVVACDSYLWMVDGNTYSTSGTYTDVSINAAGCTHTEILNLTINTPTFNTTTLAQCSSYTWPINGNTYNSSGIYTDVSVNAGGCTHTETLNLTIDNNTSDTSTVVACDSYFWTVDGNTYNTSGTYTDVNVNSIGCTHTEVLNLTINTSTSNSTILTECDSYTWPIDGNTYNTSGIYIYISSNTLGCTHVDTLDLTINNSSSVIYSLNKISCDSFIWNGTLFNQSGVFYDTISSINGCDSIQRLNLTIINSPVIFIVQNAFDLATNVQTAQYLWSTGENTSSITPASSGSYWCIGYNSYGCASDTAFFNYNIVSFSNEIEKSIRVFPNPTFGVINISFTVVSTQDIKVRILNQLGEELALEYLQQYIGDYNTSINLSIHAKGIYFLEIETGAGLINKKLILQ